MKIFTYIYHIRTGHLDGLEHLITHLSTLDVAPMTYLLAFHSQGVLFLVCFMVRCQRFLDFLVFRPEALLI